MIDFNQELLSATALGGESLLRFATEAPLPANWLNQAYRVLIATLLPSRANQQQALARIGIEMIKFNHKSSSPVIETSSAPEICRYIQSQALSKIASELSANI